MKQPTFAGSKARLWPFLLVMVVLAALCPVAYGGVQVSATPMPHCVVLGTGAYDVGSVAQLSVAPEVGWQFDHWEGDVPAGQTNDNPVSLQVTTNGRRRQAVSFSVNYARPSDAVVQVLFIRMSNNNRTKPSNV